MPASYADREQAQPRTARGDAAAAGTELAVDLFERYHEEIYGYLCGMLHEPEWAQDLAQETFLRALQARRHLAEVHNHRAWLYRVATNVALNALKRRRRFTWLPWRPGDDERRAPDVADEVAGQSALDAALAALPPAYRAPLLLHAEGLSPAEVGAALGLGEAAARKRIYRAGEMLRQAYKGDAR